MSYKKYILLISIFILGLYNVNAQVGIGTTTPGTTLQIKGEASNTSIPDGIQVPVLSLQQLEAKISSYGLNQDGAIVYINTISPTTLSETVNVVASGYYYYDALNDIWKGFGNSISNNYYLGQDVNGGIVYHIYIGSDGLQHGLIVSKTESSLVKWQTTSMSTNSNRSWDGSYNTNLIISGNSPAKSYISTNFASGWYLPSIDELSLLYQNRYHVNNALYNLGATLLGNKEYWSSTEFSASNALYLNFLSGVTSSGVKNVGSYTVRAVKSF